eukprot:TRINITY_DN7083_c0_g1_i3.p1 TRINITY_DN7083_c0_g1~~TRINITY_DN7083_c0_g1_i3.p1  ORF type:complete len:317 (+),score=105.15 TRINITY_DN7083_c0_g1_i3:61-951(+)
MCIRDRYMGASKQILEISEKNKTSIMKDYDEQEDCDEDKEEEFKQNYEEYNDLMQMCMELHGILIKLYRVKIEKFIINNIAPFFYKSIMRASSSEFEILYCVCFFDDLLEFGSQEVFNKAFPEIAKKFLSLTENQESDDIIQSIGYGFGVFAMKADKAAFAPFKSSILQFIAKTVSASDAFSEEKAVSTECVVGALGKVGLYQYDSNDGVSQEALVKFVELLPLKNEPEEAQNVHRLILKEILNKNQVLVSQGAEFQHKLEQAIGRIKETFNKNPELEILDDEGALLLQSVLGSSS